MAPEYPQMLGEQLGPYRIEWELGAGGMGRVFAATLTECAAGLAAGERVAVKVVHPHLLTIPQNLERVLREGEIGRSIQHPNVVRTFDTGVIVRGDEELHYLAMEYVEGQTLRDLLFELGRVPEGLCRHIGREIAIGLEAIHEAGVVHRDIKPENVLITPTHVVKVMDLGVARLCDATVRLSQSGAFAGSIQYAAPEQFGEDGAAADHRADLHGVGLLLYELATGHHPFAGDDFHRVIWRVMHEEPRRVGELNPQLSPLYEELVHTLLAKDPGDRFESARAVVNVLRAGELSAWWKRRARELRARDQRPLRRIRIPRETELYGREAELGTLRALYERVRAGDGQVVLVEGEAGIGKTRLIDEFVARLQQEGEELNFLFGAYPPGGAATGAGAFSTAYREHFGAAALEETLREHLGEYPLLVPGFAAVLRGDPLPKGGEPLTKDSLHTMFVETTRELAARRTTIVMIDDLHFTPDEGRALFAALALAIPGHRVLLIGTARPGLPDEWVADVTRHPHTTRLPLARLGAKDLVRLLGDVFHSERLAENLAGRIAVKSDGNPFFVFEIIRGLREGQFITRAGNGSWVLTRVIEEIRIPSSVLDLVAARISDLEEADRDLLDVASCCGFEFDPLLVAASLEMDQIPAMKRFARIEQRHRLVRAAGRAFVFDHHQVREALYGALPPLLREPYHAKIAAALEARAGTAGTGPGELDGAVAVDLCEHFLAGAQGERASRYLDAALDHLEAGHLHGAVVAMIDRVIAVRGLVRGVGRVKLLLRQAPLLELLGRADAERCALEEALGVSETIGDVALASRAGARLGWYLCRVGRFRPAEAILQKALERSRDCGDRRLESQALGNLGKVYFREGRYDEAEARQREGIALARELGDRDEEAIANVSLGNIHSQLGRIDDARRCYETALAISRKIGQGRGEAIATGNLGSVLLGRGQYAAARSQYERRLALAHEFGDRRGEAFALDVLGVIAARLGDLDRGRELLEECRRLCSEIAARRIESYAVEALAKVAGFDGKPADAEGLHRQALSLRRAIDYRPGIADTLAELGALLARQGREDEARACLAEALELARDMLLPGALVRASSELALLEPDRVGEALAALAEFGSRAEFVDTMESHFAVWRATSDATHLNEAHRMLLFIRDGAPEECRESLMTGVPVHREIEAAWEANAGH